MCPSHYYVRFADVHVWQLKPSNGAVWWAKLDAKIRVPSLICHHISKLVKSLTWTVVWYKQQIGNTMAHVWVEQWRTECSRDFPPWGVLKQWHYLIVPEPNVFYVDYLCTFCLCFLNSQWYTTFDSPYLIVIPQAGSFGLWIYAALVCCHLHNTTQQRL